MTIDKQIQQKVMALTGLTEESYNVMVHDTALEYLSGFIPNYPQVVSQITKSSIFWSWWMKHWEMRDKEFIEKCYHWDEGIETRLEIYKEDNDPRLLVEAVYLSGQVLEESYSAMIGEIMKAQKKEVAA